MLHALRRGAVALALVVPLIGMAPVAAHADTCGIKDPDGSGPLTDVYFPCPGPQDVLVAPDAWYTTTAGPGHDDPWFDYIVIARGGHIIYTNDEPIPWRLFGAGWDSGWVPSGMTVDIPGVPNLAEGQYAIYEYNGGTPTGTLYVRAPSKICVQCIT
jgi:hypothetical protein